SAVAYSRPSSVNAAGHHWLRQPGPRLPSRCGWWPQKNTNLVVRKGARLHSGDEIFDRLRLDNRIGPAFAGDLHEIHRRLRAPQVDRDSRAPAVGCDPRDPGMRRPFERVEDRSALGRPVELDVGTRLEPARTKPRLAGEVRLPHAGKLAEVLVVGAAILG